MRLGEAILKRMVARLGLDKALVNPATVDLRVAGELIEIPTPLGNGRRYRELFRNEERLTPFRKTLSEAPVYDQFPEWWKENGILEHAYYYSDIPHGTEFVLVPDTFYLARTVEEVDVPPGIILEGSIKSTTARLAINHSTALLIDPGYKGSITLEITTALPTAITIGQRLIQVAVSRVQGSGVYGGRYQGKREVAPAKIVEGM